MGDSLQGQRRPAGEGVPPPQGSQCLAACPRRGAAPFQSGGSPAMAPQSSSPWGVFPDPKLPVLCVLCC